MVFRVVLKSRQRRTWDLVASDFTNSRNTNVLPKPTARDSLNPHRKVDLGLLGFFLLMTFFVALTAVYVSPEDFSRNKPQLWGTMDAIDTSCHTCHSKCNCNALALNTDQTWNSFLLLLFNGESTAGSTCGLSWTSTSSSPVSKPTASSGTRARRWTPTPTTDGSTQVPQPLPPPQQPVHPTTSPMTSSPTPPPESSAAGNVAPTIPLQDPVQLPQQITTAMHSITDRLDILIAGMGQMFQLPLQALAYQLPQQAQPQLQAIPNQPTQPPPPQPTAPTAPVTSTPPPATPGATSTASTQVEPPHTSHRRSRSTTHRRHKSTRRSRTRSHRRRRSPRSQHRQRGPTARSDHHPSKTTSRSVRLIPNPRGSTPYDAFTEKTKERRPLSRPHRRQHRDMDVRNWREEEQPEEPSESATPAQST